MQLRTLHAYAGMLIAPTVLFMALTGLLQIYSLHEDHGAYHAPRVLEVLGSLHKDQKLPGAGGGHDHHDADDDHDADHDHDHDDHDHDKGGPAHPWAVALLKAFFAVVAVGLFASTSVGIWMACQNRLRRRTHLILLAAGVVIPLVLAFLAS